MFSSIAETSSSFIKDTLIFLGEIRYNLDEEGESLLVKPNNTEDDGITEIQDSYSQEVVNQIDLEQGGTLSDKPEKEQLHCPLLSAEEYRHKMDAMILSSDWESITLLTSSFNAKRGTKCEHTPFCRIRFYQHADIPLGKILQDNLLNQVSRTQLSPLHIDNVF